MPRYGKQKPAYADGALNKRVCTFFYRACCFAFKLEDQRMTIASWGNINIVIIPTVMVIMVLLDDFGQRRDLG